MTKIDATKVQQLLNKIATFERSKHLSEQAKAMLIDTVKQELDTLTNQTQLPLEAANTGGEPPAPQQPVLKEPAGAKSAK